MTDTEMMVLDETAGYTWDSKCDGDVNMNSNLIAGVAAKGTDEDEARQIEPYNNPLWRFFMHFTDRPVNLIPDSCRDANEWYRSQPHSFTFDISGRDEDVYFSHPDPQDGDDSSDNDQLGLALDLIGAVGGTYADAGTAIVDYLMDDGGSSPKVDVGEQDAYFDVMSSGGYNDLPREASNPYVAGIKIRVTTDHDDGRHAIDYVPQYTFEYPELRAWGNPYCGCLHDRLTYRYRTNAPAGGGTVWFEAENPML